MNEKQLLRDLVLRAQRRDPDAWEGLYRRNYRVLFGYARRRLFSDEAADDAVSETMTRAISAIDRFRWKGAGVDAWLILPKGQFYEVWFVGPGDAPSAPNRISAGTFHPDEHGRTSIVLLGAIDPKKLPELEITAEPGVGIPLSTGPAVLR